MRCKYELCFSVNQVPCIFKQLSGDDVTDDYIDTLIKDNGFIENINTTFEAQKDYVNSIAESEYDLLCGIYYNGVLAATSGIQTYSDSATIGILVFKHFRRLGLGKTLIWAASTYVYNYLKLKNFDAGVKKNNMASIASFLACGFIKIENKDDYSFFVCIDNLVTPSIVSDIMVITNE